jgi:DNA processing protein
MGEISREDKISALQLFRSENVGPKAYGQLVRMYGSAAKALEHVEAHALKGGKKITLLARDRAEKELKDIENYGAHLVVKGEDAYPELLAATHDAPPLLTVLGNKAALKQKAIAIVGARNASVNGSKFAAKLAGDLGSAGFMVVSGLARGIDTAAHHGALPTGTVAVLAGGIDHIYPKQNTALYKEIVAHNGAIIAELPFGAAPQAQHFPRRNRIISGLARATIVVEAGVRSGSLITARLAGEQGREVCAVPGFPGDPRAEGPNKLLKQGATLIETAEDVIEALTYIREERFFESGQDYEPEPLVYHEEATEEIRDKLLDLLSNAPLEIDSLIEAASITPEAAHVALLELELAGKLTRHPGNRVSALLSEAI